MFFPVKSPKNVLETAQELGACEFVRYVRRHGLYDLLTSGGPYTIFVPTDEAFSVISFDRKTRRNATIIFSFVFK